MTHTSSRSFHSRLFVWDVLLAIVFGAAFFVVLNIVALGLFVSLLTAGAATLIFGLVHYLVWGRTLARAMASRRQQDQGRTRFEPGEEARPDQVTLALNEQERTELVRLLKQSLPTRVGDETDRSQTAVRQELLDRIRMFGA